MLSIILYIWAGTGALIGTLAGGSKHRGKGAILGGAAGYTALIIRSRHRQKQALINGREFEERLKLGDFTREEFVLFSRTGSMREFLDSRPDSRNLKGLYGIR